MANFNMQGQQVGYQYIAAGDINFGTVTNTAQLAEHLDKLSKEVDQLNQAQLLDDEKTTDAKYNLTKAVQQAKKPEPDKKSLLDYLSNVKSIVEGAAAAGGIVKAVGQAIQLVQAML